MSETPVQFVIEAALFTAGEPLTIKRLQSLFPDEEQPSLAQVKSAIADLQEIYVGRAVELVEVASGFRFQAKAVYSEPLSRLWEKKPPRYSRALMETLALIVYRQPITRGEIEEVRGVSTSSHIMKTLMERGWVKVVGHKEVPGRPSLYGTDKAFLDYFGMSSLKELPELKDIVDLDAIEKKLNKELALNMPIVEQVETNDENEAGEADEDDASAPRENTQVEVESASRDDNEASDGEEMLAVAVDET